MNQIVSVGNLSVLIDLQPNRLLLSQVVVNDAKQATRTYVVVAYIRPGITYLALLPIQVLDRSRTDEKSANDLLTSALNVTHTHLSVALPDALIVRGAMPQFEWGMLLPCDVDYMRLNDDGLMELIA